MIAVLKFKDGFEERRLRCSLKFGRQKDAKVQGFLADRDGHDHVGFYGQ